MENSGPIGANNIDAILIHGVGNPRPGSVKRQAQDLLTKAGVPSDRVHEFNWNQYVDQPVTHGFLSPRNLSELGAAVLNTAWLGFEDENRLIKMMALLLELVLGFFPLVVATFILQRYPEAARAIIPGECCKSFRSVPGLFISGWGAAVFCLAFLVLAISILHGSRRLIIAAGRRVVLLVMWPFMHLMLLPFLIPWHAAALVAFTVVTRSCMTFRVNSITQPDYWLEILTGLGLLFIVAFLIAGAMIGAGVIAPQVKLLADVIRYLGLPPYRNALHDRLRRFIADIRGPESGRVLLIAHSLGSVIAIDFLSDPGCPLAPDSDISLITLGSPLGRLFARFFGQVYPQPPQLARWIRQRFPRFIWINIFRPLDYVGGRLAAGERDIQNICTGELRRFHTGYWGDNLVAAKAECALRAPRPVKGPNESMAEGRRPAFPGKSARSALPGWACLLLITTAVGVAGAFLDYLDSTLWEPERYRHEAAAAKSRIDSDPVDITGVLRRKFGVDRLGPPDNPEYFDYKLFELTFTPLSQGAPPVKWKYGKYFKSDPVFSDLKWSGDKTAIHVRYLKGKPGMFYLPGEDPGDPEDIAVPLMAGFHALLFRAAPLAALTWLIYATLFGLLATKT
jgi:hypothetical protein